MPKARFIRSAPRTFCAGSGHGSTLRSVRSCSDTLLTRIFSHRNCNRWRRPRDCPHNRACPPPWPPAVPGNSYRGAVFRQILASFLPPFRSSCSRPARRRRYRRQEGRNFDLSEVQHPLAAALFPNQVPIDATAKHNPGLRISPSVTARVRRHLHENLREIDIAMPGGLYPFCGPAGSDRFASTPRSRARGGQFARGLFQSVPPVNAKYSKDPKIRVRSSSGGRCSRI